jgi:hypothetical protein
MAGSVLERHLCDECREEELGGLSTVENELKFECRCGEVIAWRFPHGGCGHPSEAYTLDEGDEIDIGSCSCGARYVMDDPRWTCQVCGAVSIVTPRETGERGVLYDHIHGEREATQIRIRAFMP